MKTPPFPRISQSDCNAEQCELFRTKNKWSQRMPVDGGPLNSYTVHCITYILHLHLVMYLVVVNCSNLVASILVVVTCTTMQALC